MKYLFRLFEEEIYANRFIMKGELYLNSFHEFVGMDDDLRYDCEEGVGIRKEDKPVLLISKDKKFKEKIEVNLNSQSISGYIYCLFATDDEHIVFEDGNISEISEDIRFTNILEEYYKVVKNKNDAMFVVLMEEKRLSDKITEFFNSAVLEYKFSDVLYKDFDINERAYAYLTQKYETIAFNKRLKYSYQNERRLFIPGVNDEHPNNFPLQIGDLSGYVVCYMKLYFDDIKHFS